MLINFALGIVTSPPQEANEMSWLEKLANCLVCGRDHQVGKQGGVKIIDFSEVPSDILPLVIGRVAQSKPDSFFDRFDPNPLVWYHYCRRRFAWTDAGHSGRTKVRNSEGLLF